MPFKNPHPLYSVWNGMRQRCRNPRFRQWADYGGRGIKICDRWESFAAFLADIGPRPPGFVLDRKDNDGNYTPENCRWVSTSESQRNRRVTVWLVVDGERHRAVDLAERAGLKTDTIIDRARNGLPMSEVLAADRRIFKEGLRIGGKANGARLLARTHCKNGHPWNEENTRYAKRQRECRACARAKEARRRAARG